MNLKSIASIAVLLAGVSLVGFGVFADTTGNGSGLEFEFAEPATLANLTSGESHRLPLEISNPTSQDVRIVGDSAC